MENNNYKNLIATIYDKRASIPFDGETNKENIKKDLELVSTFFPDTTKSLLDIGCGSGWHLENLLLHGYEHLAGIDLSTKALLNLTKRLNANVYLINDDFITHSFQRKYDCLTSFHSCIGQYGEIGDKEFVNKIYQTLNPNGVCILTAFTQENVAKLEGTYNIRYSAHSKMSVFSKVSFDNQEKKLKIVQKFSRTTLEEKIKLYKDVDIVNLLYEVGFPEVKIINGYSGYYSAFTCFKSI